MGFNGDVAFVVLETIIKCKSLSVKEILEDVPFDRMEVVSVLTTLAAIGVLVKEDVNSVSKQARYFINKDLTAYHITKAVELGVDIGDLTSLLPISDKQKKAALALSAEALKLKEMDETIRQQKKSEKPKTTSNLPRDMIVETLERLTLASEISIEDYSRNNGEADEILKALQNAREQALKALKEYQSNMGRWEKGNGY